MTDKVQIEAAAQAAEDTPAPKKTRVRKAKAETAAAATEAQATETPATEAPATPRKPRAKKAQAEEPVEIVLELPAAKAADAAEAAPKAKKPRAKKAKTEAEEPETAVVEAAPEPVDTEIADEAEEDEERAERPPAKLDRLQKILSQAGIASRRHAEEMIEQGRVMVNGQVVSELGAKADAARDHIRVDGKLLQGAERLRYFVLNKPKGYVTTVSDPEGRPTVMEFFAKTGERLYPVGRLDYLSEGLLLMTNDGELANLLTKAASGVEKTYLVKVSGQPSEEELDVLRGGVAIERDKPGSDRVKTAAARIQQVRQGDNPWFEVVLIEGRNRELRKMFEQIGHFVEKIRRVGYGPLVLDQEPGKFRELDPEEVTALRLTAEGKIKPRRVKTVLPPLKEAARPGTARKPLGRGGKPEFQRTDRRPAGDRPFRPAGDRPQRTGQRSGFGPGPGSGTGPRSGPRTGQRPEPRAGRPEFSGRGERPEQRFEPREPREPRFEPRRSGPNPAFSQPRREGTGAKPGFKTGFKPEFDRPRTERPGARPAPRFGSKPGFSPKPGFESKPGFAAKPGFGSRPGGSRPGGSKPSFDRPQGERPGGRFPSSRPVGERRDDRRDERGGERNERFAARTGEQRPFRSDRPRFESKPRFEPPTPPARPSNRENDLHIEEVPQSSFRPRTERPEFPRSERPAKSFSKPPGRSFDRAPGRSSDRGPGRAPSQAPGKSWGRGPAERPARTEGSAPSFRGPSRPAGQFGDAGRDRPAFGDRPKPAFGAKSRPAFGSRPGGFSKPSGSGPGSRGPGFKSRPGGPGKPSGSRPSNNRFGPKKRG